MRTLAALLIALSGFVHGQAQEPVRYMSPNDAAKFEARLRGWANAYYPALTATKKLPDGIILGFLVDRSDAVLAHTVALRGPDGVSVPDDLVRLFPGHTADEFMSGHGAACFGVRPDEPRYCVEYAVSKRP
jgi:hypothetical protein